MMKTVIISMVLIGIISVSLILKIYRSGFPWKVAVVQILLILLGAITLGSIVIYEHGVKNKHQQYYQDNVYKQKKVRTNNNIDSKDVQYEGEHNEQI